MVTSLWGSTEGTPRKENSRADNAEIEDTLRKASGNTPRDSGGSRSGRRTKTKSRLMKGANIKDFEVADARSSLFKVHYERGDLPVQVSHGAVRKIEWKADIMTLNYDHYLPIFVSGLKEAKEPYCFIAFSSTLDLLEYGGERVLATVPKLVQPLKKALDTKNRDVIKRVCLVLRKLVTAAPFCGEALVPYYRQILPIFNYVFLMESNAQSNLGDRIDYGQRKNNNLIETVQTTLEIMEEHGGENAFINIKYIIPVYDSSVRGVQPLW